MERLALEAQQKESESQDSEQTKTPVKSAKKSVKNMSAEKEEKKSSSKKKQKLYCVCRTPYDKSKWVRSVFRLICNSDKLLFIFRFYIGCDLCNNWFHGECVGISEEKSKEMTDFICDDCEKAKSNQELFCLCRTPYDQAQ